MNIINVEKGRMEHAIGLSIYPVFHKTKNFTYYKAYRNYYTITRSGNDKEIDKFVEQGLMEADDHRCFRVTEKGYKHLEQKYDIKIVRYVRSDVYGI